ncbi:MAG TPA: protein kinase [Planctomycetaceae bacterium]|nr:protein kinase [Planctomycetaceae bacterium]
MIQCPHCGRTALGADLVSGVCSACRKPLASITPSELLPGDHSAGFFVPSAVLPQDLLRSGETAQTLMSSEFAASDSAPASPASSSIDKTLVSDDVPPPENQAELKTLSGDAPLTDEAERTIAGDFGSAASGPADQTLVAESRDDATANGDRTLAFESPDTEAAIANDRTLVSQVDDQSLLHTLQSQWGPEDGEQTRPDATLKAREKPAGKNLPHTLVIKTKSLQDLKIPAEHDLDAEYELLKVLGEGGMGVVYDARQTSINRHVALKMIKGAAAESDKQKAKFLAEAVVTGDLDHPNIVPIYDVGKNSKGSLFYSMKKVQGTPWNKVIREKSLAENLEILMRVADAIGFAHARGIIHRDLKPENTMLGDYGEVLVMDWGLALPAKHFGKSSSLGQSVSMGGTPAYMAPEMATGPIETITAQSDVYLLGAMLFEVVTGKTPHQGKTALKCLMAAARNEITPTEKSGELLDIALKAMATTPADRYVDVRSFQGAIREYQSHTESIFLSDRAEEDLALAAGTENYQAYAKAVFGFQESLALWTGNKRAAAGLKRARHAYADLAHRKGDYDLGLSLLDAEQDEHRALHAQLLADKEEREARKGRLAALKKLAIGLAAVVFTTVTVAFFWISYEADRARRAEFLANQERDAADVARDQEKDAKQQAIAAKNLADQRRIQAEQAQLQERQAKSEAVAARDQAEERRQEAEAARAKEELAKRAEEYEAYIAQIGLAAAKINENAFDSARELLKGCKPELRNWEWGRLMHLCSQSTQTFPAGAPLDALALSPDGTLYATGGWDGTAKIWNRKTGELKQTLKHGGNYVHAVAFSPDGTRLATAGDDPAGAVQLWNIADGRRVKTFTGHKDAALSIAFSKDGRRLLSASYDQSARLWDIESGRDEKVFRGHTWWVWQAAFSPDETQIVTVSQDGTALIWDIATGDRRPAFTGHRGPVYCAAFTDDGRSVVTGGFDRRVLVWRPEDLQDYNFRNLGKGRDVTPPAQFQEWTGHATAVRSLAIIDHGQFVLSAGEDNTVRLWDRSNGTLVKTFRGHDSAVRAAVASADGRALLSASHDATVREWSIAAYEELRTLQGRQLAGHADAVLAASFSPNQQSIVTASRDRTARTWNALTGELQQTFEEGHEFLASSAIFFDGGRQLITAAVDNTTRVWDVATGAETLRLDHTGRAAAIAINPSGTHVFTGGTTKQAQQWDLKSGKVTRTYPDHRAEVTAVALSPDEQWLLTGDAKGYAALWNVSTGKKKFELKAHTRRIAKAAFLPDGSRALTASGDNTVAQWDLSTGKEIAGAILKHPDGVLTTSVVPDGQRAVTSCADRMLRLWDLAESKVIRTIGPLDEPCQAMDLSEDGTRLLVSQSDSRVVRMWELETGREIQSPQDDGTLAPLLDLKRSGGLLWAATFAPGDGILVVGGSDARLWDLKTNRERMTFSPHGAVASAHFSPDNTLIVTGSWDHSARLWNAATGKTVRKLEGEHSGFVNSAIFSPAGEHVLTASDDGTAKLWTVSQGKVVRTFAGHTDRVRSAGFSADGQFIITTSSDKTARLWNVATGEIVREFAGHQWAVLTAHLSRDGTRLITGSEDNIAKVWDLATGECLLTLAGHTAPVASVAFSPDATRALTGSRDQAAKLWDAHTGKEILTLNRHTEDVTSVSFSPDGKQVLTASRDGTAIVWPTVDWKTPPTATAAHSR